MTLANNILSKVTYHAVYDESVMDALQYARTGGFAGVQLAVEVPHLNPDRVPMAALREAGGFRARHAMRISLHTPDHVCSLFETARGLSNAILGYYSDLLTYAEALGASLIVLHLGDIPSFRTDAEPPARYPPKSVRICLDALRDNLGRLATKAAGRAMLAIENFQFEPPVLEVLEPMLGQDGLGLCWDLAKTYRAGVLDTELERFFWRNLRHIKQVHLHDIRDGRQHCVIGTGSIDFMRFLPRLAEAEVSEYAIEVRPREKALESLTNLRELLASHLDAGPKYELHRAQSEP